MSALQKRMILIDENLSKIVGKAEGGLTSYAELTKGIHDYVKRHNLKKNVSEPASTDVRFCYNCGSDMGASSAFCDKCGKKQ